MSAVLNTSQGSMASHHLAAGQRPSGADLETKNGASQIVYPQSGQPMLPHLLVDLLKSRPIQMPDGTTRPASDFAAIRPEDLGEADAQHVAEAIASIVQSILYGRRNSQALSEIHVKVPRSIALRDLPLSSRVRVALQSRPFFDANGPWRNCSLASMICEQSLGAKLLLSFLVALQECLRKKGGEKKSPSSYLEEDLAKMVSDCIHAPRSADVYLRATGWDGRPQESLVQIASRLSISKERARQIFALANLSIERHLENDNDAPGRLHMAIDLLFESSPLSVSRSAELLREQGLSLHDFDPRSLINIAEAFNIDHQIKIAALQDGGAEVIMRGDDRRKLEEIASTAKGLLREHGLVCASWLHDLVLLDDDDEARVQRLKRQDVFQLVLESGLGLSRLSRGHADHEDWYWHPPRNGERPQGVIAKAMKAVAFFGAVPWEALSDRLLNPKRNTSEDSPFAKLDNEVLASMMNGWGLVFDSSERLTASSDAVMARCKALLPKIEAELGQLIVNEGGRLARSQFLDRATAAGIKSNTALTYLKSSSLLRSRTGHSDPWVELLCKRAK